MKYGRLSKDVRGDGGRGRSPAVAVRSNTTPQDPDKGGDGSNGTTGEPRYLL